MIVTHKINMNLDRAGAMPRVDAVQGDANTREIQFTLFSGGQPWEIPSEAQVLVRFKKSDGTGGTYDTLPDGKAASIVSGNTVTVTLVPQVVTAAGTGTLAVTLVQGTQELTTFSVLVNVIKNPTAAASPSGDYVSVAGMIPVASGASAGQYLAVTTVDADGTVTGVKAVNPLNGEQPIVVLTAAEMDDTEKIYLYMGAEDGWQYGAWYYYNGSTWAMGNAYGIGEKGEPGADAPVDTYLPKTGGTMSGPVAMDGNKITGLGTPTDDGDAVNKAFLDAQFEFTSISPTLAPDAVGSVVIYKKSTAGSGYVVNIWLGDVTANAGTYIIGTFAESVPSCAFLVFGAKGSGIAYCYVQENVMYLQILSTAIYSEWWKGHIGL